MQSNKKTTVICSSCRYQWRTRRLVAEAACPKCGQCAMRKLTQVQIREAREAIARMAATVPQPRPKRPDEEIETPADRHKHYGRFEVQRYVKFLGCWSFVNPTDAVKRRDPQEYRSLLQRLIEVNRTRWDNIGFWEVQAAERELKAMGG